MRSATPLLLSSAVLFLAAPLSSAEPPFGYGSPPAGARACLGSPRFTSDKPLRSVAISRDGKRLAAGTNPYGAGEGTDIHVWDLTTGQELHCLKGHQEQVVALHFMPDNCTLVSAAWDNTVRVWDTATGKEQRRLASHEGVITGLVCTDSKRIITSSQDRTFRVWDIAQGKEMLRIPTPGFADGIALSPDGKTLAAASGGVVLWDAGTGKELRLLMQAPDRGQGIRDVCFSPDGKTLAVLDGTWQVLLIDADSGKERFRLAGNERGTYAVAFSPDGKTLATGGGGYLQPGPIFKGHLVELRLWDASTGKVLHNIKNPHNWNVASVAFSPDGKTLISAGGDSVRLWDVATGREDSRFVGHREAVRSLVFTPDSRTLISASADHTIRYWDADSGKERASWIAHKDSVTSIALTPDGKTLASGSSDRSLRLWDLASRREVRCLSADHGWLNTVAFSPDGKLLASGDRGVGGAGGSLRLWDWKNGKELQRLTDQGGAHCVSFAPDGKTVAAGHHSRVHLFETEKGRKVRDLEGAHSEGTVGVAYLPDGLLLTAGGGDGTLLQVVRLHNPKNGERLHDFGGLRGYHSALALSPNGRLVAGAFETDLRVWETATLQEVARFRGHRSHITALAFSPDGRTLASGGADTAILLWRLNVPEKVTGPLKRDALISLELDLRGTDAVKARRALWSLVAVPEQSIPLLKEMLPIVPSVDARRIEQLIAELDSKKFAVREKAMDELTALGDGAAEALRQALEGQPSAEQRQRITRLLAKLDRSTPIPVRVSSLRAFEVLEAIGTPAARKVLQAVANGQESIGYTREAAAALRRLNAINP